MHLVALVAFWLIIDGRGDSLRQVVLMRLLALGAF